ncbi:uncharacterized protein TNCV_2024281 [Trichonephila clavipes]|nr:uncharacterized protein TNCV_2024281 [Trichonephila clavipes]
MQLQTGIEPLDSRRDKFTFKYWKRARRVDCRYWNEYRCATQRLKTQTSLSHAELLMKKHQLPLLMTRRASIPGMANQWHTCHQWHATQYFGYASDENGWFCRLFEGSLAVGQNAINYDEEVLAVCEATTQLLFAGIAAAKVVFFIDSQAAVLALSSNTPTDCLNTIQY